MSSPNALCRLDATMKYPNALVGVETVSASVQTDAADMNIDEFYCMCKRLASAIGYSPEAVREYFEEE